MLVGKHYDYLVVGGGLYGSVFAHKAAHSGKKILLIDKRQTLGGNTYCEKIEDIIVHKYGPHIFHTSNKEIWNFVTSIVQFNRFTLQPLANYKGRLYNLPLNMNTFYALWNVKTPQEAMEMINQQKVKGSDCPKNLEEQAISLVGHDVYKILIKGYTEKQWGRNCKKLPPFIISRLPIRFTYDNNYFNDLYQGVPIGGYNELISGLLTGIETYCNTDFFDNRQYFEDIADKIVFTGRIDEYYNYKFGKLEYRTMRWDTEIFDIPNYQGVAVVNFTDAKVPYTRIIEHKHFEFGTQSKTVISREYPQEW